MFVLQKGIEYRVEGIAPAPTFFSLNSSSGVIRSRTSFVNDVNTVYYMRILVADIAYPNKLGTGTCTIFINRNPNTPRITSPSCLATIPENTHLGTYLFNVTASDADTNVGVH